MRVSCPVAPKQGRGAPVSSSGLSGGPGCAVEGRGGSRGQQEDQAAQLSRQLTAAVRVTLGAVGARWVRREECSKEHVPPHTHSRAWKGRSPPPRARGTCPQLSQGWGSRAVARCRTEPWRR